MRLDEISLDTVEDYIAAKLAEADPLSACSINMTLTLLGAILETAVERDSISRNPAIGKRRRVRERTPQRSYLESAAQIRTLLDAAEQLDRTARADHRHIHRKAMLARLAFTRSPDHRKIPPMSIRPNTHALYHFLGSHSSFTKSMLPLLLP
jgi:hypothetical protein